MSEKCQKCKRKYQIIYRVPDEVWKAIAPNKDTLGDYDEHLYGGLLCAECAWVEAKRLGICLYFDAKVDGW